MVHIPETTIPFSSDALRANVVMVWAQEVKPSNALIGRCTAA
jgi:hypothetical protein